jgi:predicted AAA+ superfamily ATPase
MFENLVIRDLLSIMEASDGQVFHYRDESQLEVDAVIEDFDGNWGAIEVKLGFGAVDNAAKQLLNFAKKIDTDQVGHPKFLAVVTQTEYNYQRPDGVYVLSANALQP